MVPWEWISIEKASGKTWFEAGKCFLERLWCRILIKREGRVITEYLGIFSLEKKMHITHTKKDNTLNFLPFLWKYILFDLHTELIEILMNQMLPGVSVFLSVRYFRLTTVTLCWIKEQFTSHTLSCANFSRHFIGFRFGRISLCFCLSAILILYWKVKY